MLRYDKCRFCCGDGCLACGGEKARVEGASVEAATWKKRLNGREAEQLLRDVAAVVPGMSGFGRPGPEPELGGRPGPSEADLKLAARFGKWAEALTVKIENKSRPMTQNPTPKRIKEFNSRLHDAANLKRGQAALLAMADALERCALPGCLRGLKFKKDILPLVGTRSRSEGYYQISDSGEYIYEGEEAKALQAMIAGGAADLSKKAELARLEAKAKLMQGNAPGFFPTPEKIARDMVSEACIASGERVLEPSAGAGAIADIIREMRPETHLFCIERNSTLRQVLEAKGHDVIDCCDFLEFDEGGWDAIIQNPPFEKGQDMEHTRHAYDLLADYGTLVTVMIEGVFFGNSKKHQVFREWLDEVGWREIDLPAGAFKESGSGAKARILILSK